MTSEIAIYIRMIEDFTRHWGPVNKSHPAKLPHDPSHDWWTHRVAGLHAHAAAGHALGESVVLPEPLDDAQLWDR